MLVLTRRAGEAVQIGDNITVVIVRTGGDRIRIGISAPDEMDIVRTELLELDEPESIPTPLPTPVVA